MLVSHIKFIVIVLGLYAGFYSLSIDEAKRIHVPLFTNEEMFKLTKFGLICKDAGDCPDNNIMIKVEKKFKDYKGNPKGKIVNEKELTKVKKDINRKLTIINNYKLNKLK